MIRIIVNREGSAQHIVVAPRSFSFRLIVTPRRDTMRQRDKQAPQSAEETVRDIRRATRRHFSAEERSTVPKNLKKDKLDLTKPIHARIVRSLVR
jgi:hypothetical protein